MLCDDDDDDMKWVQNTTIKIMPIGVLEVVRHDVKHMWILFLRNFMVMLTD